MSRLSKMNKLSKQAKRMVDKETTRRAGVARAAIRRVFGCRARIKNPKRVGDELHFEAEGYHFLIKHMGDLYVVTNEGDRWIPNAYAWDRYRKQGLV